MRRIQVEIVVRAVEIRGHYGGKARPILAVVSLAHLYASDFRHCVGLVSKFQWPGEQILFLHRLRAFPGIDARTSQKEQTADSASPSGIDYIRLDDEVVVDEFGTIGIVG